MQQYAGIYLLQVYSTRFGRPSHSCSGVQKTVITASGTGHSNSATEAAVTVFCTPDDGHDGCPKHVNLQ